MSQKVSWSTKVKAAKPSSGPKTAQTAISQAPLGSEVVKIPIR